MLQLLKDDLGLTANSHAEEVSSNSKKKAKTIKLKENVVNFNFDSDDDLDNIIGIWYHYWYYTSSVFTAFYPAKKKK